MDNMENLNNPVYNPEDLTETKKKYTIRRMRSAFSNLGLGLFAYGAVAEVLYVAFIWLLAIAARKFGVYDEVGAIFAGELFTWGTVVVFNYLIGGSVLLLILRRRKPETRMELPKNKLSAKQAILLGIVCISVMQIGSLISAGLSALVDSIRGTPLTNPVDEMISESSILAMFIMSVIIAPVVEEIIYRKLVIDRLRFCGEGFALVCSSLIFGLAHGNFYQLFYAFGFGMVLGFIYIKTNNIKICMAYHMIFNFIGSIIPMLFIKYGNLEAEISPGILFYAAYLLLLFSLAIAGIFIAIVNIKNIKLRKSELADVKTSEKVKAFVLNVGMILLLLTTAGTFAISFLE